MSGYSLFNMFSRYTRLDTSTNPTIAGPLMAHYIMALLGHNDPASEMFSRMGREGGRLGDYVFNQEGSWQSRRLAYHFPDAVSALDQIITQLMENSNANRPVPASEDVIDDLRRDVLLEGCESFR